MNTDHTEREEEVGTRLNQQRYRKTLKNERRVAEERLESNQLFVGRNLNNLSFDLRQRIIGMAVLEIIN